MSTLVYAAMTRRRIDQQATRAPAGQTPSLGPFVDAVAGLVPAEVLSVHAVILTFTTQTSGKVTTITEQGTLTAVFFALIGLSMLLYAVGRLKSWEPWDYARMFIPPLAFVAWTMLQRSTAFDAVLPGMNTACRLAVAVIGAVVLGTAASVLAIQANKEKP
jgi:hypothetical protein